jgi:hypothetical protein
MTQPIKRVVISLDAVSESDPAIDTAARLAARWGVPLHGVFVEDEELIGLAGLPFARQVTLATGLEPLTKDHVEDHFRAFAARLRGELAAAQECCRAGRHASAHSIAQQSAREAENDANAVSSRRSGRILIRRRRHRAMFRQMHQPEAAFDFGTSAEQPVDLSDRRGRGSSSA